MVFFIFILDFHHIESPKEFEEWDGQSIVYEGLSRKDMDHLFAIQLICEDKNNSDQLLFVADVHFIVREPRAMGADATSTRSFTVHLDVELDLPAHYRFRGKIYRFLFIGLKDDGTRYPFFVSKRFGFSKDYRPYSQSRKTILEKGLVANPSILSLDLTSLSEFYNSKKKQRD